MTIQTRARYGVNTMASGMSMRLPGILLSAAVKTILIFAIISMVISYYFQMTSLTVGGYELSKLENQKAELMRSNEELKTEVASFQSMSNVEKRLEGLGMVKASNIKYIKVQEGSVAKR